MNEIPGLKKKRGNVIVHLREEGKSIKKRAQKPSIN